MTFENPWKYHREWGHRKRPVLSAMSIIITIGLILLVALASNYFRAPYPVISRTNTSNDKEIQSETNTEAFIKAEVVP